VKRFLATLAIPLAALGALGFAACGDDDDEPDATVSDTEATDDTEATSDTEPSSDTEPTDDTGSEITLPDISLPDVSVPGGTLPGGITIPDFTLPDISLPDVSIPDVSEILSQAFPNLTDEQVDCLADALGDVSDIDMSQLMEQIGECDIDLTDLTGGG
jgi:hypothetical protein